MIIGNPKAVSFVPFHLYKSFFDFNRVCLLILLSKQWVERCPNVRLCRGGPCLETDPAAIGRGGPRPRPAAGRVTQRRRRHRRTKRSGAPCEASLRATGLAKSEDSAEGLHVRHALEGPSEGT